MDWKHCILYDHGDRGAPSAANSDYQKYIRFFTGLVLVILLATPILKIFGMEKDLVNLYDSSAIRSR